MRLVPTASILVALVGSAFVGAGIGWASPATEEPLDGVYTRTIVSDNSGLAGHTGKVTFTPCGTDCIHWDLQGGNGIGFDMQLQGDKWMRTPEDGTIVIIDKNTLQGSATSTSGLASYMTFLLAKDLPDVER